MASRDTETVWVLFVQVETSVSDIYVSNLMHSKWTEFNLWCSQLWNKGSNTLSTYTNHYKRNNSEHHKHPKQTLCMIRIWFIPSNKIQKVLKSCISELFYPVHASSEPTGSHPEDDDDWWCTCVLQHTVTSLMGVRLQTKHKPSFYQNVAQILTKFPENLQNKIQLDARFDPLPLWKY